MTRHLESCEQRTAVQGEIESRQKAKKIKAFHLVVEGYRLPMYWMHLQVAVDTTLETLDRFLRDTWLECCGHLSVFRIGGFNYYVEEETDAYYYWDERRKNMQVKLEEVFSPGQTCSYEYDFGSTTELTLKVIFRTRSRSGEGDSGACQKYPANSSLRCVRKTCYPSLYSMHL